MSQWFRLADVERSYELDARFLLKPGVGDEITGFLLTRRLARFGATPEQVLAFAHRYDLTDKQMRVVAAACIDRDRAAIAVRVRCTVETVHTHVNSILVRTGADDLRMVVQWVRREQLFNQLIDDAEPSRAEPSRAEPSRAEPSKRHAG